jgi:hypothetical protein
MSFDTRSKLETQMVADTVVLNGQLIQNGERFLWWVVSGAPSRVTVSHPARGTITRVFEGDPKQSARTLAKEMLSRPLPTKNAAS